jgi:RNA recognition motif-containing protein
MTTEDARKLFVAGLPESMTEDVLRQLFEATGSQVVEVSLPRDRATGRPRGFGFVTLQTVEQAERARSALDGSVQVGRAISVRSFQGANARREPRTDTVTSSPPEDRTLYVGNLPYDASAEEVEQVLERAGVAPVIRVHMPVGPDGRPRGFGFVTLASPEAVLQAIPAVQNAELRGRRVMVKVAHPRGAPPRGPVAGASPISPAARPGLRPDTASYAGYSEPPPPPRAFREPQPSAEFEEEEDPETGAARASTKTKPIVAAKGAKAGKAAPKKGRGERAADDHRSRGGGASWQRWEDWDDD